MVKKKISRRVNLVKNKKHTSKKRFASDLLGKKLIQKTKYFAKRLKSIKKKSLNRKAILKSARTTNQKTRLFLERINILEHYPRMTALFIISVSVWSLIFYFVVLKDLPYISDLTEGRIPLTTIIRDRNGKILYRVYKNTNRVQLTFDEIPEVVKKATVAIEDANFYQHHGISLKALTRAFIYNLQQKDINLYQGGSTLTQQLVKNRLLGSKKEYIRKIREIFLAVVAEMKYSKQEILTMYLNEVGYGGPAHGIEAASQMYFGIPAKNLTLAQAALLAGLPAAPTTFSPLGTNPTLATDRQHQVLERMLKLKMIGKTDYDQAIGEKLVFAPPKTDIEAPHFVMFVKQQMVEKLGEAQVEEGGLDVVTTLDLDIQKKAEELVKKNIADLKDRYNIHNASALVTNPKNGEILAMVGSVDYFDTANRGYVNITNMPRQPGSSIKPVNYAYLFSHGYTPSNVIEDSPVVYVANGAQSYAPQNYDGKFHGTVTLRSALANSYNVPAVKLLNTYGVEHMIEEGRAMGIKSWDNLPPVGLSLTLGSAEVTILDMARVYGTIANLGVRKELKFIKEIRDKEDHDITASFNKPSKGLSLVESVQAEEGNQVIPPLSAFWLTDILSDNVARLPAFGPYAKLTIPGQKVAVKTGTSNSFRDNWTIGFTPDYLVATWVGNTDGSFMNKNLVSGITGAAPIWNDIMDSLLAGKPPKDFPVPKGLIPVKICAVNGLLTCPNCPQEKTEYYTADKVPTKQCFFKSASQCEEAKKQLEGKSDEEKKQMLSGCPNIASPKP